MLDALTLRPQYAITPIRAAYESFMLDREAARYTPKTLEHYRYTTGTFVDYLESQGIREVGAIKPSHIRMYLVSLQQRGLKDTTQHAHARGIKTWLRWLVAEGELETSPMDRVSMPKLEKRIPAPFAPQDIKALLDACDKHTPIGSRNYALVLTLLDTGLRAAELCSLRVGDIDQRTGMVVVMGKGQKMRQVRVGSKARAAILQMLSRREDAGNATPLWISYAGNNLETDKSLVVGGLQTVLRRLGQKAGVVPCAPHRFRRTFALWCLRDGMDLHSLRMLMGHSCLDVLQRYLALAGEDLERAHKAHSPVDRQL